MERIGFSPSQRELIVKGSSTNVYIHDIAKKSWVYGLSLMPASTNSNFINDPVDGKLLYLKTTSTIGVWEDPDTSSQAIIITTKDIDFGNPGLLKNVYKVKISHKGEGTIATPVFYTNGGTSSNGFSSALPSSATWTTTTLTPSTPANAKDINSFQLKLSGTCTDFEINDISIIYRMKGAR